MFALEASSDRLVFTTVINYGKKDIYMNFENWLHAKLLPPMLQALGKDLKVAKDIPIGFVISEFFRRLFSVFRGVLRLRTPVFLGKSVEIRGKRYLSIAPYSTIEAYASLNAYGRNGIRIGKRTKIGRGTIISVTNHFSHCGAGVEIGDDCGIGAYSFIGGAAQVSIGNGVIMGQYVSFHPQTHNFADTETPIWKQGTTATGITIEHDVWVGAGAKFLDGAYVGRGSVVASGAVVRSRFEPYSIVGGVPAKLIKSRLDPLSKGRRE